jgi:ADP-ribose pyrophosphatase YjhB (NUDIX family)
MHHYCLAFAFDAGWRPALFIKKKGPEGSRGLNGLGGELEEGETAREAMSREFKEEGGTWIAPQRWTHFATLNGPEYTIDCFADSLRHNESAEMLARVSAEPVSFFSWPEVHSLIEKRECAWNFPWLVHLAYSSLKGGAHTLPILVGVP